MAQSADSEFSQKFHPKSLCIAMWNKGGRKNNITRYFWKYLNLVLKTILNWILIARERRRQNRFVVSKLWLKNRIGKTFSPGPSRKTTLLAAFQLARFHIQPSCTRFASSLECSAKSQQSYDANMNNSPRNRQDKNKLVSLNCIAFGKSTHEMFQLISELFRRTSFAPPREAFSTQEKSD